MEKRESKTHEGSTARGRLFRNSWVAVFLVIVPTCITPLGLIRNYRTAGVHSSNHWGNHYEVYIWKDFKSSATEITVEFF